MDEKRLGLMEFIGLEVTVSKSAQRRLEGLRGRIVDETKNTFVIEARGKELIVPKKGNWFAFEIAGRRIELRGDEIAYRPEDRLKKLK